MRGVLLGSVMLVLGTGVGMMQLGSTRADASGSERARTAQATLKDADGETIGRARLREGPHGVVVQLDLENAPAGSRAFHVHTTGQCDPPGFTSAGDHFAPQGRQHGFLNEHGAHAGDLPNLHVPQSGRLSTELFLSGVTLGSGPTSLLDGDGTAFVLHEGEDDYRSDPAGDAGDRVACGVITR